MSLPIPDIRSNLFDLSGRTSVVTGAAQGIGFAFSKGLASAGSAVVMVDMNAEKLEASGEKIRGLGAEVTTVAANVTDRDAPDRIVSAALELGGGLHALVNNAGIMSYTDMLTIEDEEWDRMHSVNLRAPMRIMRAALNVMVKQERGSVINIGSSWSSQGAIFNQDGGGVDYCSAKAAVQGLTKSAAQDVARYGVRVNAIAPGAVDTPMHAHHRDYLFEYEKYIPIGRMQVAEDLVGTAIFLASDASTYITGQTIHVNGGFLMVD